MRRLALVRLEHERLAVLAPVFVVDSTPGDVGEPCQGLIRIDRDGQGELWAAGGRLAESGLKVERMQLVASHRRPHLVDPLVTEAFDQVYPSRLVNPLVDVDALEVADGHNHIEIVRQAAVVGNGDDETVGAVPKIAAQHRGLLDRGQVTGRNRESPLRAAESELKAVSLRHGVSVRATLVSPGSACTAPDRDAATSAPAGLSAARCVQRRSSLPSERSGKMGDMGNSGSASPRHTASRGRRLSAPKKVARDRQVVIDRNRGLSWTRVAQRNHLSERQSRNVYKQWRDAEKETILDFDPMEWLLDTLHRHESIISDLGLIAEEADNDAARVGALRTQLAAIQQQASLLVASGLLPRDLRSYRNAEEADRLIAAAAGVLDRRNVGVDVVNEILELIRIPNGGAGYTNGSMPAPRTGG